MAVEEEKSRSVSESFDVENMVEETSTVKQVSLEADDKDIDGGNAWFVLAGGTMLFCVFGSTTKGLGIFFNGFIEEFGASSSITNVIPGVLQGTNSLLTLPVLTVGVQYFSTRQLCIVAGILSSAALIVGSFANSINILIITNGVMIGMAYALIQGPLLYLNSLYFVKRRNLAQSITVAGFSCGGVIFPPISSYLINEYGLRGGTLITGGILLHIIALALLLKPKVLSTSIYIQQGQNNANDERNILLQLTAKDGDILNHNEFHDERERNNSETLPSEREFRIKTTSFSEQNLNNNANLGSINKILTKLSYSNVTRMLGESDIISLSISDLHGDHVGSCDSIKSSTSANCCAKVKFLVDFSVFKQWFMCYYLFVYCIGSIGSGYLIIFIAPLAQDCNVSKERIASLVSIVNFCDFFGRLIGGVITDRNILKNHQSVIFTLFITTVTLAFTPLYKAYWHFVVFAIVSGLCSGGIFALTPSVIVDFLGLENFRSAMGIFVLGQGVTMGLSAPFIGFLRDSTGTYVTSFYFLSLCEFTSVAILVIGLLVKPKSLN